MKTKGQMEAMGLIIIVLLVLVGIFLLISFGNAKPKDTATGYNEKLINSFVSTLPSVEIAIGDRDLKMKDVIRACKFGTLSNACGELDGALETILDNSLKLWGYHYEFNITAVDIGMVYPDEKDENNIPIPPCIGMRKSVRAEQPVALSAGAEKATISLKICYN